MAKTPNDFRDPQVTETKSGGAGKWIGIAVVVLILLALAWYFGLFGDNEVATVPADGGAVVNTEDGAVVNTE